MPVSFSVIKVHTEWDRNELAELWGFKSFHAIARGVVTPAGDDKIILFVTEDKQAGLTQYTDRLRDGVLEWEGEDGHGSDRRITRAAAAGDEIHVFYRERHHSPFTYIGTVTLRSHQILSGEPSEFVFDLPG